MRLKISAAIISLFLLFFIGSSSKTYLNAEESSEDATRNAVQKKINEYESKLSELRNQKSTLSSQIQYMDTQIYLTELRMKETTEKIEKTEYEIGTINDWIDDLDVSLDQLSKTLLERIIVSYKTRKASVVDVIFDASSASDAVNKIKYYEIARESNKKVLMEVQEAKLNYEEQRKLREKKKKELDTLQITLADQEVDLKNQQESKRQILETTQNDEKTYQQMLAQAKAEYAAIQKIVSGTVGNETFIRNVSKGESIASIIPGSSCNSNGGHLHFIVQEGTTVIDPFTKLKSVDNSNDSGGDSFSPSGSWDWPIPPSIELHQGYGNTWFVRTYGWYGFHNGIDITGSSNSVSAVADGKLYRGSYVGFNGCALQYVKVVHNEANNTTLYLHVNY